MFSLFVGLQHGYRFLWNANEKVFEGRFLWLYIVAVVVIVIDFLFIVFMYRLTRKKDEHRLNEGISCCQTCRTSCGAIVENFDKNSLQIGLQTNTAGWWSYDLARRFIIHSIDFSAVFLSQNYPDWARQHLIIIALFAFFAIHVHYKPYTSAQNAEERAARFFRSIPFSWLDCSRENLGKYCNIVEGFVLGDMILIALLSTNTFNDDGFYSSAKWRVWLIYVLILIPLFVYFSLVFIKIGFFIDDKIFKLCCSSCRQPGNLPISGDGDAVDDHSSEGNGKTSLSVNPGEHTPLLGENGASG